MNDIRIAAVIFTSVVNQARNNLDRMLPWIRKASDRGVDIICFPELNATGYSTQPDIKKSAEPIPGTVSRHLVQMAREHQIVILAGMAEKNEEGRIFASHLVVTPDAISGIYRKIHIAPPERAIFSSGNAIPLFKIRGVRLGIQLCYDVHFPELSTRMAVDGADIIFMPHASPRGTPSQKLASWLRHLTARAFDNSVFVVACNQTGANQKGLTFPGVAVVIDPSGEVMKKKTGDEDGIVIADLSADALEAVRGHHMRYFLPNRRPDIY